MDFSSTESSDPERVTPLGSGLLAAIDRLSKHPLCMEIVAENLLFKGGVERFLQRLVVWALNTLPSPQYWGVLEIFVDPLKGPIDMVCFRDKPEIAAIHAERHMNSKEWHSHADGFVEMKDNWNLKSIDNDIGKLFRIWNHCQSTQKIGHEYFEILFIHNTTEDAGFELKASIHEHLENSLAAVRAKCGQVEIVGSRTLLDEHRNPSDGSARTSLLAVLLRLEFTPPTALPK